MSRGHRPGLWLKPSPKLCLARLKVELATNKATPDVLAEVRVMTNTICEDRRIFDTLTVFALMIRCPAGDVQQAGCPFIGFRKGYELEEKFLIAEKFSDTKCQELQVVYDSCRIGVCPRATEKTKLIEGVQMAAEKLNPSDGVGLM